MDAEVQLPNGKTVAVRMDVPPPGRPPATLGLVLTHGAGGDLGTGLLPRYAQAAASLAGIPVARFTCKPVHLATRVTAMKAVMAAAPQLDPAFQGVRRWVVGGHSMGARVAAAVAAEPPPGCRVAGCLLSSYPVHPPGKPDQVRDVPLVQLRLPLLFLRGGRDPFSTPEPWAALQQAAQPASQEQWQVVELAAGDHSLKVPGGAAGQEAAWELVQAALLRFLDLLDGSDAGDAVGVAAGEAASQQSPPKQRKRGRAGQGAPAGSTKSKARGGAPAEPVEQAKCTQQAGGQARKRAKK